MVALANTTLGELLQKIRANSAHSDRLAHMLHSERAHEQNPTAVPLSLTYVTYIEGDHLGKAAAIVTLAPLALVVWIAAWFAARRELQTLSLLLGTVLNAGLCVALKLCWKQPRPVGSTLHDFGMPSNHSQTTAFVVAYTLQLLWREMAMRQAFVWKPLLTITATVLLVLVGSSRVYLGEHSREQVIVGAAVGLIAGLVWHTLYCFMRPTLLRILEWRIARYFYVRDCSHVRDVLRAEDDFYRASFHTRNAKGM